MCGRVRPCAVRAVRVAACDRVWCVRCVRPRATVCGACGACDRWRHVRRVRSCAIMCDRVRCVWCVRSCATVCAIRATVGAVCAVCDRVRPLAYGGLGWAYGVGAHFGPIWTASLLIRVNLQADFVLNRLSSHSC